MKFFKFCSISNYAKVSLAFLVPSESLGVNEQSLASVISLKVTIPHNYEPNIGFYTHNCSFTVSWWW